MNKFAPEGEVFDGWIETPGRDELVVEELHEDGPVQTTVHRPEGMPTCYNGLPVQVLHMRDSEGHEVVSLYRAG